MTPDSDSQSDSTDHVGPIVFADETARRQLQQHGEAVTFRAAERTTGATWWRKSRTGVKMGDCTVTYIEPVDPSVRADLNEYQQLSGFDDVRSWQAAIKALNDGLTPGHLYRVETDDRWAECGACNEYSPDVTAYGRGDVACYRCPDCAPAPADATDTQ
jgi:hypothetical protein